MTRVALRTACIAALIVAGAARAHAEAVVVGPNIILGGGGAEQKTPEFPNGLQPGRGEAKAPAPAQAYRFTWDTYSSVVVVGDGTGTARPAWVLTFDQKGGFVVGYRAKASKDAAGVVHVDARGAIDIGPMADEWSPDSFAFPPDGGAVYTLDDNNHGNEGKVDAVVPPDAPQYRELLQLAQALISGSI